MTGAGRRLAGALLLLTMAAGLGGAMAQTPPAHVYGSTEDVRFMSVVEGMLEAKMQSAPRPGTGKATIEFTVGDDGRVTASRIGSTSGDRALDAFAVQAPAASAPFPAPPPLLRGKQFVWIASRDPDGTSLTFKPQR